MTLSKMVEWLIYGLAFKSRSGKLLEAEIRFPSPKTLKAFFVSCQLFVPPAKMRLDSVLIYNLAKTVCA